MAIVFPRHISAKHAKDRPPCDVHRRRLETERQRKADFARQNASIALKMKGLLK